MSGATTVIDIVAQVTDETSRGTKSAESNISKLEKSMQNLQKQMQGMKGKSKLEVVATLKDMASKGLEGLAAKGKSIAGKVWTVTLKAVDLVTAPFKKIWSLVSNPVTQAAAFAGVSLGIADTINTFKDFEQGMANVKAISGASDADFQKLTETAKHLGETTQFSASQAAAAMENLAMAGWKTENIVSGMPGLLDLAAAGSVDLATASDVVSSALAQFSMTADESTRVADVLAATATNSKTDVQGLGESLKYAGTIAGQLGYEIEDVALALGTMGNSSIDASSAGTALRTGLMRLSKQEGMTADETNAMAKAAKKLGVEMKDETGQMKPLRSLLVDLRKGFSQIEDETERASIASALFGQNASTGMLALMDTTAEGEKKLNDLAKAIDEAKGKASEIAKEKMNTLEGSFKYLQSAAEGVKIAIGEKLQPYIKGLADWITNKMPDIQNVIGEGVDFITGKIDSVLESIKELTASPEWQNAGSLGEKIRLAWDEIIAKPFSEWWESSGKAMIAEKANSIGEGIGSALSAGILALLGVDVGSAATDGVSIGKSFAEGFAEGFDGHKIAEAIWKAIKDGLKGMAKDASTLLPGQETSETAGLSAAILGAGAFKVGRAGYKAYKGGKAVVNGVKTIGNFTGISSGIQIAKAAKTGGAAAESALAMAEGGALGTGAKIGAKAAGVGGKAIPIIGGLISLAEMGVNGYKGTKKAEEWTGSDSTGAKVASAVGGFLGGTGNGILGNESVGKKAMDIGGGALAGAGVGAAIGSVVPGIGTAIGAGVGAGVGAVGAAIGGSNISAGLNTAGEAVGEFFTQTVPDAAKKFAEGAKGFFTGTVPTALGKAKEGVSGFFKAGGEKIGEFMDKGKNLFTEQIPTAISNAKEKVTSLFTETIPEKFDEFKEGLVSLFTEQIPYAIGYATGKLETFFTETVPEKWEEFTTGVTNFFTETVPSALSTIGEALSSFFTETVPEFFGNIWEGVSGFFTQTIPAAIQHAGQTISQFFTTTLPQFFTNLWTGITGFFTQTVAPAIQTVGAAVTTFFTSTVPNFFKQMWDGITTFLTSTVPSAIEKIKTAATTFFTTTVPAKITEIWTGITNFMTQQIPAAISAAQEAISGFFSGIGEAISGFFNDLWSSVTSLLSSAKSSFSAGHAAATGHAEGGIMTKPHIGLVGEDGAEAIIPLTSKRKNRGIALWQEAGKRLGILPHAEGGIFGMPIAVAAPEPVVPETNGGGNGGNVTISVTVNMNPAFTVDGGSGDESAILDTIERHMGEISESAAWEIAQRLRQIFPNMPTTEVG